MMEPFGIRDVLYIGGIALTAVITFIGTRHKLKELIRDKNEETKEKISDLRIEIEKLKSKDDLQQQVIDQFQKQVLDHLPRLFQIIENNKTSGRK